MTRHTSPRPGKHPIGVRLFGDNGNHTVIVTLPSGQKVTGTSERNQAHAIADLVNQILQYSPTSGAE